MPSDAEIKAMARAMCKVRGIDPDFVGKIAGTPIVLAPAWETHIDRAREWLMMREAERIAFGGAHDPTP
jgi:hypothetical protein